LIGSRNANFAELNLVMDLVAQGRFKPVIHAAMPLAQAALAHRTMAARDVFGKVVLLP
jgi:NADPH2:quinone reductase